jgi:hypothetical protein
VARCRDGEPWTELALQRDLSYLASPALDGRAAASPGDTAARRFVVDRFRCLELTPGGDDGGYEQRVDIPAAAGDGATAVTANLIGYLEGTDDEVGSEIILVGAHLDHLGGGYLGANDNASGVAGLLALAHATAKQGAARRTIAFVTFAAEELGLLGSRHFLAHPPPSLPLDRIVQMINLDMIGSYASRKRVYAFGAFARRPASALLRKVDDNYRRIRVSIGGHSVRGDHQGFCQLAIPYVFFWTPDARCYHATCDTADRIDYPHLLDIASLAADLVRGLADTEVDLLAARHRHGCRR